MNCPQCGAYIAQNSSFCGKCGYSPFGVEPTLKYQENNDKQKIQNKWQELKLVLIFYILFLACSLVYGLASHVVKSPKLEFVYWFFDIILTLYVLALTWKDTKISLQLYQSKPKIMLELAIITACSYVFLQGYFYLFEYFQWPMLSSIDDYVTVNWPIWSFFILGAVLPGIFEEVAFRGIIQTNLTKVLTNTEALIIQAALFSALHISPMIFISHFVMGLLVGWARLKLGHIYYGIILHITWNSLAIIGELVRLQNN